MVLKFVNAKSRIKTVVQKSIIFYFSLSVFFYISRAVGAIEYARSAAKGIVRFFPNRHLTKILSTWLIDQPVPSIDLNKSFCFHYCLIIKGYVSPEEKGVILISFERQLDKLSSHPDFKKITDRYFVIFVPSTTGYLSDSILRFRSRLNGKFATFPVHRFDIELSKYVFGDSVFALNYSAASWVNFDNFRSKEYGERNIDCLMVANFGIAKRHWLMFKILEGLPDNIFLTCVGLPVGSRGIESLIMEAKRFGVRERVNIIENPTQENLRGLYAQAKVFCATSYIEGAYIGVAEALASGTPVAMFKDSLIGTKSLINENNGFLVESISDFRASIIKASNGKNYNKIRESARVEVDGRENSRKLNCDLKAIFIDLGMNWSQDIKPFYSERLTSRYFDTSSIDDLNSDYEFYQSLGISFSL